MSAVPIYACLPKFFPFVFIPFIHSYVCMCAVLRVYMHDIRCLHSTWYSGTHALEIIIIKVSNECGVNRH